MRGAAAVAFKLRVPEEEPAGIERLPAVTPEGKPETLTLIAPVTAAAVFIFRFAVTVTVALPPGLKATEAGLTVRM